MAWNLEGSLKACRRLRSDILTPKFAACTLYEDANQIDHKHLSILSTRAGVVV